MAVVEATLGHGEEARDLLERAAVLASSPAHRFGLELWRIHVGLSLAPAAGAAREELRAMLRLADVPGSPWVAEARILARVLLRSLAAPGARASNRILRIAADASWVEPPDGARIACGNRPVMRRLLSALATAHDREPRAPLSADQLFEACWPGERLRRDSAKNRLHVLLTRTRSLGFRELIEGDDRGYAFAADLRIERAL